jgi:uncharacterized SAM-binding protein YcdF (DUF218 family)
MFPAEWKPLIGALVLPPAGPLLLVLLGLLLATWRKASGLLLAFVGLVLAWALSTNGVALALSQHLLRAEAIEQPRQLDGVQAIVVLGGGVLPRAPEYGVAQPGPHTLARLRYGAWLARRTGKPLAFAGGVGWGATGTDTESEGSVARRVLHDEYGLNPRWLDDKSRDTAENAARMAPLLRADRVRQIALVTDATHMERAAAAFRAEGFAVLEAPTNFPAPMERPMLEWLPSVHGADTCRQLLREWLARSVGRAS